MAGNQRKGGKKRIPTPSADVPKGLLWSGMWDARDIRKYGRRLGAPLLKKGRWDWISLILSSRELQKDELS